MSSAVENGNADVENKNTEVENENTNIENQQKPSEKHHQVENPPSDKPRKVLSTKVTGWFDVRTRCGFIITDETKDKVFVHQSAISRNPRKYLNSVHVGDIVQFNVIDGEKGLEAVNVTGLGELVQDENAPSDEARKALATNVTGWFNVRTGFGFIITDDTKEKVFVHRSAISCIPKKYLRTVHRGEVVQFDLIDGQKGLEATNVIGPGELVLDEEVPSNKAGKDLATKVTGTIKWFDAHTGYGFIITNDTKEEVSVHESSIKQNNPKCFCSIYNDEVVKFDVIDGRKGLEAVNITGPGEVALDKEVPSDKAGKVLATNVSGTVKWFNVRTGYGFIIRNETKEEVFVHQSSIKQNNLKKCLCSICCNDEVVKFYLIDGRKGSAAANVTRPKREAVQGSKCAPDRHSRCKCNRKRGRSKCGKHQRNWWHQRRSSETEDREKESEFDTEQVKKPQTEDGVDKIQLGCEGHNLFITHQSDESNEFKSPSFFDVLLSGRWRVGENGVVEVNTPYKYMSVICNAYNTGRFRIETDVPKDWDIEDFRELLYHAEYYCLDLVVTIVCVEALKYVLFTTIDGIHQFVDENKEVIEWPGKGRKDFRKYLYVLIALNALRPGKLYNEKEATEAIWHASAFDFMWVSRGFQVVGHDRFTFRKELVVRRLVIREGAPATYKLNLNEMRNILVTGEIQARVPCLINMQPTP